MRLSTIEAYPKLASKAEVLSAEELGRIKDVAGYARQEVMRVDERREGSGSGEKAEAIPISAKQQCCKA